MKRLLFALWSTLFCVAAYAAGPQVQLDTNKGTIIIELNRDKAPATVENFVRYVEAGFYDGTIFHRVIPGFMIQGGGYSREYERKETNKPIKNEADNGLKNVTGSVAMARTGNPHSATAQFFINVADNGFLDFRSATTRGYGYAVFGKVVKGMDVVKQIAATPTGAGGPFRSDAPLDMVMIEQAKLLGGSQ